MVEELFRKWAEAGVEEPLIGPESPGGVAADGGKARGEQAAAGEGNGAWLRSPGGDPTRTGK